MADDDLESTRRITRRGRRRAVRGGDAARTELAADDGHLDEGRLDEGRSNETRVDEVSFDEATVRMDRPQARTDPAEVGEKTLLIARRDKGGRAIAVFSTERARPAASAADKTPVLYRPRPAPRAPKPPPTVIGAGAATRRADPERPSVARASRRRSALSLGAFGAACAVSVVGLTLLGLLVWG